jgi:hypothetical protein
MVRQLHELKEDRDGMQAKYLEECNLRKKLHN